MNVPRLLSASLLAAACSVPNTIQVERRPGFVLRGSEPLRIAILPLRDTVPPPSIVYYLGRPFVWCSRIVTLDMSSSMPTTSVAAGMMRALLAARLAADSTTIVDLSRVDCSMKSCTQPLTDARIVELAREHDVDAILEGELHSLGAGWGVVRTNRELAGVVRLRSAEDGKVLFRADVAIGNSVGIDHGPTGWVSLVATPLAALGSGPYTEMAIDWAEVVGRELLGQSLLPGAGDAARLSELQIVAPDRPLAAGDAIEVSAIGTRGGSMHFDIGVLHRNIPMYEEGAVADGGVRYRGIYRVRAGDRADRAPITVHSLAPQGGSFELRHLLLLDIDGGGAGTRD